MAKPKKSDRQSEADALRAEADKVAREVEGVVIPPAEEAPAEEAPGPVVMLTGLVVVAGNILCNRFGVSPLSEAEVNALAAPAAKLAEFYDVGPRDEKSAAWYALAVGFAAVVVPRMAEYKAAHREPVKEPEPTGETEPGPVPQPAGAPTPGADPYPATG